MFIFLFGPDSYRSHQKLAEIRDRYITTAGDTNLTTLEGADLAPSQFSQQVQALPFLANTRLVIIKNLLTEGKKETQEAVIDELEKIPTSTVVLFYEHSQPDKRTKLFQSLNKPKIAQEFEALTGIKLAQFAANLARKKELKISDQLIQILINQTGSNLWQLDNEIEKLSLYQQGTGQPVTQEIIENLTADLSEINIFHLTDALGSRDAKKSLKLLGKLEGGESALGLLALIAGQFRNLLMVTDGLSKNIPARQLNQQLKLNPYVFDKSLAQARSFTHKELIAIYRYLFQLDLSAKQSLIEPLTGLTILAQSLSRPTLYLPDLTEESMV